MVKKRPELNPLFIKTEREPQKDETIVPSEGHTVTTGVGIKEAELALIDQIAEEHGVTRNALMRWLIRYALKSYLDGKIDFASELEFIPTRRLRMP